MLSLFFDSQCGGLQTCSNRHEEALLPRVLEITQQTLLGEQIDILENV